MLLAIEVYLTSRAFGKGWRYWVLVPWALMITASLIVGSAPGAPDVIDIPAFGVLLDVVLLGTLVYMSMRERGGGMARPAGAAPFRFFGSERG